MKWFLAAVCLVATVRAEPLVRDGNLKDGWTWRRENPAGWRIRNDVLEIRVEPGNMWGPANDAKNVLVKRLDRVLPHHEMQISMTLSNKPTEQYEQVDLVWYYDDSHMVKIGQELVDGKLSIVMGREEKDRTRTIAIIPIEALQVNLRLTVTNSTIRGAFRPSGSKEWREAGSCDLPIHGEPHVAIQCYQGPANAEHWARISDFVLESTTASASSSGRPNILFILADDLGINDLACYGRKEHHTPNLDQLAREGMRFTASYCAQPICSPSRAAILTGKAPARLHLTTYLPGRPDAPSQKLLHPRIRQELPLEEITLAEALKTSGYATACIGKWHLGGKGFLPTDQGFDFYHPGQATTKPSETEGGKGEYDLTRAAIAFIETNRAQPFFLYLAHNSPHIPYAAKANLIEKNKTAFEPVYAAVIETLDDTVGLLLKKLDDFGLRANTIVIFTTDNGGLHVPEGPHKTVTDNSPFRAGKGFLYEGGLRVPLIARWPGHVPAGRVVDTAVINTDWFATLFELIGLQLTHPLDAPSFGSVLLGNATPAPARMFWHFPHYTNQGSRPGGAVRDGDWKFIEHYDTTESELYNIAVDPGERDNVAPAYPDITAAMRRKLHAWTESMNAQTNALNPDFKPELFRELYQDIDVSRYVPTKAEAAARSQLVDWRRQMNAVLRQESH